MFKKQLAHSCERYNIAKETIEKMPIKNLLSSVMIAENELEKEIKENSEKFRNLVLLLAKNVTREDKIMGYTYAAAVAVLAEIAGLEYELRCGYCLDKNAKGYEKLSNEAREANYSEDNLPLFVNHFYLTIDEKVYEYFNNATEIDHIYDVVVS